MGKNQDPGSGINIPDPQHWIKGIEIPVTSRFSISEGAYLAIHGYSIDSSKFWTNILKSFWTQITFTKMFAGKFTLVGAVTKNVT
jgi:hypothetical protein